MAYDMHGPWESNADHHAPLFKRPSESANNNIDYIMKYWMKLGASASKLVLGIPLYGKTWTLSSSQTKPPAPGSGAGAAGPITGEAGYMGYNEICTMVRNNALTVVKDPNNLMGPYAYSQTSKLWVGYDDVAMAIVKSKYALSNGFGGAMVWDITGDDFNNACGAGTYPMMKAIYQTMSGSAPAPTNAPAPTIAPAPTSKPNPGPAPTVKPNPSGPCEYRLVDTIIFFGHVLACLLSFFPQDSCSIC